LRGGIDIAVRDHVQHVVPRLKAFRESVHGERGAIMMKRARAIVLSVVLLLLNGAWSSPARAEVSFDFFYSNLSPHGTWQVSARYGRVWQPGVYTSGWNPYYDGHWVYADVGWTWVSDYAWGTIPYHYGTWVDDPEIGWVWVPGYVWAPAWVVFRTGPDYIGWAPVSPEFSVGVSTRLGTTVAGPFVFVSARDFLAPGVRTCVVPESTTRVIIRNTRVVNALTVERNVIVNRGPGVRLIERASGRKVRMVRIEQVPGIAPGGRITRGQIAVEPRAARHGLRAAEPIAASRTVQAAGPRAIREGDRRQGRAAGPQVERPKPRARVQARAEPPAAAHDRDAPAARTDRPARRKVAPPRRPHEEKTHP